MYFSSNGMSFKKILLAISFVPMVFPVVTMGDVTADPLKSYEAAGAGKSLYTTLAVLVPVAPVVKNEDTRTVVDTYEWKIEAGVAGPLGMRTLPSGVYLNDGQHLLESPTTISTTSNSLLLGLSMTEDDKSGYKILITVNVKASGRYEIRPKGCSDETKWKLLKTFTNESLGSVDAICYFLGLTVSPASNTTDGRNTNEIDITNKTGSPFNAYVAYANELNIESYSWGWESPINAQYLDPAFMPQVGFTNNTAKETHINDAHWYPYKKDERTTIQLESKYLIYCNVQVEGVLLKSTADWCAVIPNPGARTHWPKFAGKVDYYQANDNGILVWRVNKDTFHREFNPTEYFIPTTSRFYNKIKIHEECHRSQWTTGPWKSYWDADALYTNKLSTMQNVDKAILEADVKRAIDIANDDYSRDAEDTLINREREAHNTCNQVSPHYLETDIP